MLCFVTAPAVHGASKVKGAPAASSKKKPTVKYGSKSASKTRGKVRKTNGKAAVRSAPRQLTPTTERYMQIQQALADKGYYTGPVNGAWGADSVEALKKFQADQNLTVDGKLGSLSLIALGLGPKRELLGQVAGKPELHQ